MMFANIIALAVIIISLIIVLIVVVKKFPQLVNIDAAEIPEEKEDRVKKRLAKEKLQRNLLERVRKIKEKVKPHSQRAGEGFKRVYKKVIDLERDYKKRIQPKTPEDRQRLDKKTDVLVTKGRELTEKESFEEAESKFIDAIALDLHNVEAYRGLGVLYWERGDLEHAKETFEHILKINADNFDAYSHLGNIALKEKDLDKARDYHLRSIELDSKAAQSYLDLSNVYKEAREMDKAYKNLERAVGLEPNNPRYLDAMIDICIILGKKDDANEYIEKLEEVNPENQKIVELKKKIKELA